MAHLLSIFVAVGVLFQAASTITIPVDECTSTFTNVGIIGGENSTIEAVPYAVSIRFPPNEHVCGGAIIDKQFILTAAMCVSGIEDLSAISVRVDSSDLSSGGATVPLEKLIVHEKWNPDSITNNIALLKLKQPILFGWLAKAELPSEEYVIKPGTEARFFGWGGTNGNEVRTEIVHQTTVPIKAQKCCTNPDTTTLNDPTKICAGSPGHDACQGDGGSPLVQEGKLIGLSSYGTDESCGKLPGIYTNVVSYVGWIKENIRKNI